VPTPPPSPGARIPALFRGTPAPSSRASRPARAASLRDSAPPPAALPAQRALCRSRRPPPGLGAAVRGVPVAARGPRCGSSGRSRESERLGASGGSTGAFARVVAGASSRYPGEGRRGRRGLRSSRGWVGSGPRRWTLERGDARAGEGAGARAASSSGDPAARLAPPGRDGGKTVEQLRGARLQAEVKSLKFALLLL
jgi:hypothetical protein